MSSRWLKEGLLMPWRGVRYLASAVAVLLGLRPAAAQWTQLGALSSIEREESVVTLHCGDAVVRLEATAEHVIRVRLAPDGHFGRDFSWAVLDLAPKGRFIAFQEREHQVRFTTGAMTVIVYRNPCRLEFLDSQNHTIAKDELSRGMAWEASGKSEMGNRKSAIRVWQDLPDNTSIYGLGEKTGPLDKSGQAYLMWNTDAYGYGPASDPLYVTVPFFISARDGVYSGIFFDNPWRSAFDFGREDRGILSFGAEGGELNYYVIAGPDPKDVVRRYTELVGRIALPPRWAIGYHQCRYSYYPETRVRQVASTFRERKIPCDVIYFDIDYMDNYRCFTWSPKWFPNPKKLITDLNIMGFHTVAIIDPGIKKNAGYFVYDAGTKLNAWLTKPDGQPYVGRVWPGPTVFPDFTNPKVRAWWAGLFPDFLESSGIDGIWNDMNEPADFNGPNKTLPLDIRFDNQGEPAAHPACHNVYGMQMCRATVEGVQQARPEQRAFVMTRANYAGGQRYGAGWTGDNTSNWEHLRMSIPMVLNLGVAGMPFQGPDIGGFAGGAYPELYARWIQMGALFPYCRTHTAWENADQEPWSFGDEVEQIAREALERRYRLLPYLYTLFEEVSRTGLPILRPLWLEFPQGAPNMNDTFMLGPDIFVAPIVWPNARDFWVELPPGVWYDMATDLIWGGGQKVKVSGDLHSLPMFVRAGAIIPTQSVVQNTNETPKEPLIVDVWPFGEGSGTLYEDDGESPAFRDGKCRRTAFHSVTDGDYVVLAIRVGQGSYAPPARVPLVRFHGLRGTVDGAVKFIGQVTMDASGRFPIEGARFLDQLDDGESVRKLRRSANAGADTFAQDERTGIVTVWMYPDNGATQIVRLKRQHEQPAETRLALGFDGPQTGFGYVNDILPPVYANNRVTLLLKNDWDPYVVLPRLRMSADKLPILKLRMSTEHAQKIAVRFATEEDPTLSDRSEMRFEVTPDGQLHDYALDLAKASGGQWTGTVYWVRIDLEDGIRGDEYVVFEHLSFEPR
ncbi:MAG TPA: TIM-barrel domain-containing protein [Phycisphaerae bacterium]